MRNQNSLVKIISVIDCGGYVLYPKPVAMMRDHLGLSQRSMAQQATRETMPRDVTPQLRPLAQEAPHGWIARLVARVWR